MHHGAPIEIDIAAYAQYSDRAEGTAHSGGTATATWVAPLDVVVETDLDEYDAFEVQVYDVQFERRLVAAIEIVSPANKDRPERRNAFIGKCAALLQAGVAVSIVDLVTDRHFNLYADFMAFIGHPVPAAISKRTTYASSSRWVPRNGKTFLESVSNPLTIGEPLPKIPLWLDENLVVPLELEESYEKACRDLWIA